MVWAVRAIHPPDTLEPDRAEEFPSALGNTSVGKRLSLYVTADHYV